MRASTALIGLGSNLNDPCRQLDNALVHLHQMPVSCLVSVSSYYQSRPVGPQDQPDFVNACAWVETRLSPLALLDQLQAIEQRHRRHRIRHWGPRTLDLDLLLYEEQAWQHPRLTLPHPEMLNRGFVLVPLMDIAPNARLPDGAHVAPHVTPLMRDALQCLTPNTR